MHSIVELLGFFEGNLILELAFLDAFVVAVSMNKYEILARGNDVIAVVIWGDSENVGEVSLE